MTLWRCRMAIEIKHVALAFGLVCVLLALVQAAKWTYIWRRLLLWLVPDRHRSFCLIVYCLCWGVVMMVAIGVSLGTPVQSCSIYPDWPEFIGLNITAPVGNATQGGLELTWLNDDYRGVKAYWDHLGEDCEGWLATVYLNERIFAGMALMIIGALVVASVLTLCTSVCDCCSLRDHGHGAAPCGCCPTPAASRRSGYGRLGSRGDVELERMALRNAEQRGMLRVLHAQNQQLRRAEAQNMA